MNTCGPVQSKEHKAGLIKGLLCLVNVNKTNWLRLSIIYNQVNVRTMGMRIEYLILAILFGFPGTWLINFMYQKNCRQNR